MLIVALVLAVISLAALVTAVVTSNELIAWACIGFSALGVLLLIVDAVRDRNRRPVRTGVAVPLDVHVDQDADQDADQAVDQDTEQAVEDYPDEVVYDDPDHDLPDDDEPDYPIAAEEAAMHTISDEELVAQADSDEAESDVEAHIESDAPGSYTVVYSGEPVDTSGEEPSYIVTESPTVSFADSQADPQAYSQADTDDSIVVIYSSEHSEEERDGER